MLKAKKKDKTPNIKKKERVLFLNIMKQRKTQVTLN